MEGRINDSLGILMSPTSLVACLVLFAAVGGLFLLVALGIGHLLRAHAPNAEKLAPYECGEPPVGSSFVQFDLRFYVVALVFIIFEVEVALFFPPATIFGKATQLMRPGTPPAAAELKQELGMTPAGDGSGPAAAEVTPAEAADFRSLAAASMVDLGVFFAVVLLDFAYVWRRGDLDWVRSVGSARARDAVSDLRVLEL
jgi:NADH-quinone oxidoreductase subunit A